MKTAKTCFFCLVLLISSSLYGQWSEHRTPVGKPVSSIAFAGDRVFAQWYYPGSQAFGSVVAQGGAAWDTLAVPADPLCPGGLCGSKNLFSENGHLYYTNSEWPGFIYKSDDAGETWTSVLPSFSDFSEELFVGDYIFVTVSNVLWRSNSDGSGSFNSFVSATNWPLAGLCRWGNRLLVLDGYGLWVSENQGDTWSQLTDAISAVNLSYPNTGLFAFGNSIFLSVRDQGIHTSTDGGATWNLLPFPEGNYISCMIEYNGKLFCGDGQSLFFSTDNGQTWQREIAAPGPDFLVLHGDDFWMATDFGAFKSTDGGKSWYVHNTGLHRPLTGFTPFGPTVNKALFSHAGRLWLSTEFGLFDTPDDGATWRYAGNFADVAGGIDGDNSLAIRDNYQWGHTWHYSRDTGQTWQAFPMPPNTPAMYNPLMYANGYYYAFVHSFCYRTNNFGQDWEQLPIDFESYIRQAVFSQDKIFAVSESKGYFISTDLGMTWTNPGLSSWPNLQLYAGTQQVYAHLGAYYYRYDVDHWQNIPFPGSGNYGLVVGDQTLFAYRMDSPYTHKLLVSDNHGDHWANILGQQPYLSDLDFDLGAAAFGLHNNHFYAFGQSANDRALPSLWELEAGEPGDPIRTGKVFFDHNNNGIPEPLETAIPNMEVSTPSVQSITDLSGDFALFSGAVGDTLRPFFVHPGWTSNPPFHVITAAPKSYHFAVTPAPGTPDLTVTATATTPFRPGFTTSVTLRVINTGAVNATGVVRFVKPAMLNLTSTSPVADLVSADTVFWNLDLLPFSANEYFLLIETPSSVPLDEMLSFLTEAIPDISDSAPADNGFSFTETVVGAFDPNDKKVNPVLISTAAAQNGTWLDYTIRFQNTGTYYANLVRITDTLSEQLDIRSVQILGSSHPCTYTFREGRVLEAIFNNISLPDSLSDEAASHGFLRFAIQLLPNMAVTDTVRNAVDIFFDFNAPIHTNTAKTWVDGSISATGEVPVGMQHLLLFPNPATESCTIVLPAGFSTQQAQLCITDLTGRIQHWLPFTPQIEVGDLAPGMYFVVVKTANGAQATGKLIRQAR